MTEDEQRKFEAAMRLGLSWWNSFDRRRGFEWKICIALWSALLSFSAVVVTGYGVPAVSGEGAEAPTASWRHLVSSISPALVGAAVVVVVLMHALWIWGVSTANDRDKRQAFHYLKEGRDCAGVAEAAEIEADIKAYESRSWYKKWWNQVFQVGITVVLGVSAAAAAFAANS